MNDSRLLLCTFSTVKSYLSLIDELKKIYTINKNRFFIFSNILEKENVFVTYNVLCVGNIPKHPNTVSVHRKKQTNTLYTLNALNQIIKDENNGVLDKTHCIKWSQYENSLIITGNPYIRIIPIKMIEIITSPAKKYN